MPSHACHRLARASHTPTYTQSLLLAQTWARFLPAVRSHRTPIHVDSTAPAPLPATPGTSVSPCSLPCPWQTIEFDQSAGAVLRIQPLRTPRDENVYECVAQNSAGEVTVHAKLTVLRGIGLPGVGVEGSRAPGFWGKY